MDDSIDLGNNYRFIQDTPKNIIYHEGEKYNGVGKTIVPTVVLDYKYNEGYIIAQSSKIDENGNKIGDGSNFWIVDKSSNGAEIKPMDSLNFYLELNHSKIELRF